MLLQKIKNDQINARKNRDSVKARLLTTLYSESANVGLNDGKRESTDIEVQSVIRKFIKGIDESLKARNDPNLVAEKEILEEYLPRQMSAEELREAIQKAITDTRATTVKDTSKIMRLMKERYAGLFDGKQAVDTIKSLFSENT